MERDFLLPDVGEGLEDATVVEWHVQVGEAVHLNDPLVTIETAKASVELPSPFEGRVVLLNASEGDELRVGELLARIDTPEEAPASTAPDAAPTSSGPSGEQSGGSEPTTGRETTPEAEPSETAQGGDSTWAKRQPVLVGYGVAEERRAQTRGRDWRRPKAHPGQVRSEAEDAPDSPAPPAGSPGRLRSARPLAKPPVRWLARTLNVDLRDVRPTGARGEVTSEDVRAVASPAGHSESVSAGGRVQGGGVRDEELAWWPSPGSSPVVPGTLASGRPAPGPMAAGPMEDEGYEELPVRGVRARIAERMSLSRSTIPEATCGLWVDCERLLSLRSALNDDARRGPEEFQRSAEDVTPFAILAWTVSFALQTAPVLNASFDAEAKVIRVHRGVNLGIATSTEMGLLVPVVHGAHALGLREFAAELSRLTRSAREGRLTPAELTGSTFTVTNYGALGLDDGNPVINVPEAAILGIGTIAPRATVHEGELAVRSTAKLICAFDHRVSDGADAARFLRRLKALAERPDLLLGTR